MKLLLVVPNFFPEIGSAAHIYHDLAKGFRQRGHEVDVLTSYPRGYNLAASAGEAEVPREETTPEGIAIHRVVHPSNRDNIIVRGLEHFIIPWYYFRAYRKIGKKFDACLIYVPPLPLYYLGKRIKRTSGTPFVLNYQDFHPQELTDVGVLKNPLMIRLMEHIERAAYRGADFTTVLSPGGIGYVTSRGAPPEKVRHIYNGVFMPDIEKFHARQDFREKQGIGGKFLVSYVGILSPFQGLGSLLDVAATLRERTDIVFYIVGDGMERERLAARVAAEGLSNVRLLPLQPREEYFNIVGSSDLSIVSLDDRMKAPCIPGKMINLMATGQPVLAIVAPESETARLVQEAGCGAVVRPGDIGAMREKILGFAADPDLRARLGRNGRDYLEGHMRIELVCAEYEHIFAGLAAGPGAGKGPG